MTPEGGEESKAGSAGDIVTVVSMEHDIEEVSEDNSAEAQDYFREGYSSELAQVRWINISQHPVPSVAVSCHNGR